MKLRQVGKKETGNLLSAFFFILSLLLFDSYNRRGHLNSGKHQERATI